MGKKIEDLERAKIFMPFDALTGLKKALKEKEKIVVPKKQIFEQDEFEINQKLMNLKKRDVVTVVYYDQSQYVKCSGLVSSLDKQNRFLVVVNTKINFDDILSIE